MSSSWKLIRIACAAAIVLPVAIRASAQLTDVERACSDKMNNDSRKVLSQEAKYNLKTCVAAGGDITLCVNAEAPKAAEKRTKLVEDFNAKCAPLPAFGVVGPPAAIADEAEAFSDTVVRLVFGPTPNGVLADDKCHKKVAQRAEQQAVADWKGFRKCLKGADSVIMSTFQACIIAGLGDGSAKQDKLDKDVVKNCAVIPPPGMEDGDCGAEVTAAAFSACIGVKISCEFCRSIVVVTGVAADCDLADDNNTLNNSCP